MSIWQIIRPLFCRHQWETIGNIQRCKKCGVEITMDELTEAIAKRWDKMFGHLEEELEEFEGRDKRVKEEIERHREQMRNWKPQLFHRDADRYGERTDPKPETWEG